MSCLAIFDIDGTLVDSRRVIHDSMQKAFVEKGYAAPDYDAVRSIVGLSLDVAIEKIAPRHISHADLMELIEAYKRVFLRHRQASENHEPLYEGVLDLLHHLKDEGWRMGVATGKSRRGLAALIKTYEFDRFFDVDFCADDGPGKPHPFMVEANLRALSVPAERAVMIGDTSFDMIMGRDADVMTIGVTWGFHTRSEIEQAGADHCVDNMKDLLSALDTFALKAGAVTVGHRG